MCAKVDLLEWPWTVETHALSSVTKSSLLACNVRLILVLLTYMYLGKVFHITSAFYLEYSGWGCSRGPFPSHSLPSRPVPSLRSRHPKSSKGIWGSAVCSPSGVWGGTQLTNELVHFSLLTTILIICLRINWPNFVHFMIHGVQVQRPSEWLL